jgi:uncharacterized protein YdiU (UPF0061 family)
MFRCSVRGNAHLIAQWLRVGYTQGNMNSDNTLLAGRTLDYGPYGWMEVGRSVSILFIIITFFPSDM